MKANATQILQTIGMYVMHLPLYALLIIMSVTMDVELQETISKVLLLSALVLMLIMIPICIINVVVSLLSAAKGLDPTHTTMAIKLGLIPWYVLNCVIGYVFVGIFFNPFMMIAIPVILTLLISSTYLLMLSTSLGDIAYAIRSCAQKKWRAGPALVFTIILLFVFCLDVLGAILLYRKSAKTSTPA